MDAQMYDVWMDIWKFTPVFYRTSALWGCCPNASLGFFFATVIRPERADLKPERAGLRPETNLRSKKAGFET